MEELRIVGKSELRRDARDKVTGSALYAADITAEDNILSGVVYRSPHHHARIIKIDTSVVKNEPGVVAVITADDVPGSKLFGPLFQDQPPLADGVVRYFGEPVAIVVANSKDIARKACDAIVVEYEKLQTVFDPVEALKDNAPKVHEGGNLVVEYDIQDGDVASGFSEADIILEESFSVPRISPGYMEPENSLAVYHDNGSITVWVSSQHPFTDRDQIASVLGLPEEKVQVKSAVIGGAFGGREDASLSILTALAAWSVKGKVRLQNSRKESFLAHPKRHPARLHLKLGAKSDGTLVALHGVVHMDTGAYASYGPAVASLLTEVVPGSYRIPNVWVQTKLVYTTSPFSGAMRGFGSPQAHFAIEGMMERLATHLEIDSLDLRKKNILKPGDKVFTGVRMTNSAESLQRCLEETEKVFKKWRQIKPPAGKLSGIGMALGAQTMGLGAHVPDDSTQRMEWLPDGSVLLYLGAPDMGQGLATVAAQMTAEALEMPLEKISVADLDTRVSPYGGTTCASRMTFMVGNSVMLAAEQLKINLLKEAAKWLNMSAEKLSYAEGMVIKEDGQKMTAMEFAGRAAEDGRKISGEATFSFPYPEETTPMHLPIGVPHVIYCFGAQAVRIEIDPELGVVEVKDVLAIHDVGKAINLTGVEGQIEGGVATGIGYALYENMALKEGQKWVDSFTEYLLVTSEDMPLNVESVILEIPEEAGPYGAKGIGEVCLVPTAPAIASAVYDVLGIRVNKLPIKPEDIVRM